MFLLAVFPQLQTLVKLNSSRSLALPKSNLFSFFSLITVFSNERWSIQVKLGLCVYRSPIYHGNTKFASFFKVNTKGLSHQVKCLCELMVPHLGQPTDLYKGSEFKITESRIHTEMFANIGVYPGCLTLRHLPAPPRQEPFPNLNKNNNQNQNRPRSYLTLYLWMRQVSIKAYIAMVSFLC